MRGIFWNSRGLSDLAKTRFLNDASKEHNLDFIALLETCKNDFSQAALDNLSGGKILFGIGQHHMEGPGGFY
jgi:hypothetical protein